MQRVKFGSERVESYKVVGGKVCPEVIPDPASAAGLVADALPQVVGVAGVWHQLAVRDVLLEGGVAVSHAY